MQFRVGLDALTAYESMSAPLKVSDSTFLTDEPLLVKLIQDFSDSSLYQLQEPNGFGDRALFAIGLGDFESPVAGGVGWDFPDPCKLF